MFRRVREEQHRVGERTFALVAIECDERGRVYEGLHGNRSRPTRKVWEINFPHPWLDRMVLYRHMFPFQCVFPYTIPVEWSVR